MATSDGRKANYIVKHWRGDHRLAIAYWINGGLISGILGRIIIIFPQFFEASSPSLQALAACWLLSYTTVMFLWSWAIVGIWRSATKHLDRGGSKFWAGAAKAMCVLGGLATFGQISNHKDTLLDQTRLMFGQDDFGEAAKVYAEGSTIYIEGMIGLGTLSNLNSVLLANPQASTISLISHGGRIYEADQIAKLVTHKGLDTIAQGNCASACTMIFLAGKERKLGANGSLGFHSPTAPGFSDKEAQEASSEMRQAYERAKLPNDLIDKIFATPSTSMLSPEPNELASAKIITGVTKEYVIEDFARSADVVNKGGTQEVDEFTALVGAKANQLNLIYEYRLKMVPDPADKTGIAADLRADITPQFCGEPSLRMMVEAGGSFSFSYKGLDGKPIALIKISKC